MLPTLTGRSIVGGLDPDAVIEPSEICLMNLCLEAPADRDLERRAARRLLPALQHRLDGVLVAGRGAALCAWSRVEKIAAIHDDGDGVLLRVNRPASYALKGKAQLAAADHRYLMLKQVEPENGVVVLSLHYQAGMRATPSRVQIEREASGDDFIGFVRLRLAERAECVTITWGR